MDHGTEEHSPANRPQRAVGPPEKEKWEGSGNIWKRSFWIQPKRTDNMRTPLVSNSKQHLVQSTADRRQCVRRSHVVATPGAAALAPRPSPPAVGKMRPGEHDVTDVTRMDTTFYDIRFTLGDRSDDSRGPSVAAADGPPTASTSTATATFTQQNRADGSHNRARRMRKWKRTGTRPRSPIQFEGEEVNPERSDDSRGPSVAAADGPPTASTSTATATFTQQNRADGSHNRARRMKKWKPTGTRPYSRIQVEGDDVNTEPTETPTEARPYSRIQFEGDDVQPELAKNLAVNVRSALLKIETSGALEKPAIVVKIKTKKKESSRELKINVHPCKPGRVANKT
ncbi:unnamed protein product [Chrysodeixis includens]|uniref:Uncharacterized protein n=1 Tax=Chrysodeixis includens TaxID=689277 RepID=A0A9N8KXW9_CHRIL|nr:unnamed protein product [Chrysodeixis includens]